MITLQRAGDIDGSVIDPDPDPEFCLVDIDMDVHVSRHARATLKTEMDPLIHVNIGCNRGADAYTYLQKTTSSPNLVTLSNLGALLLYKPTYQVGT
jgi:hypothetical protein